MPLSFPKCLPLPVPKSSLPLEKRVRGGSPQGPKAVEPCLGSAPTGGWSECPEVVGSGGWGHWEQMPLVSAPHRECKGEGRQP